MNTQDISLGIDKRRSLGNLLVTIGQGDVGGTTITATVVDGNSAVTLSGMAAYFVMRLPGGKNYVRDACTISDNKIVYVADEGKVAQVAGTTAEAYFEIHSGDLVYSTDRFRVKVVRSATDGIPEITTYDERMEVAVQTWLTDHPEKVTTVQPNGIDEEKLAAGAVSTRALADGSVTTPKLAQEAVIEDKLAASSVTRSKLARNSVVTEKIANGTVTDDKLDPTGVISDVADLRTEIQNLDVTIDPDDLMLEQDPDTGLVYVVYRGERGSDGIPLAGGSGGGGGGSGNAAVLSVTNDSGWLSRTISAGAACNVTFTWSSVEDEIPTGEGIATVTVGGIVKSTRSIAQGTVTIDLGPMVSVGSNKVKLRISDVYDNARTITFTINAVELSISSNFDTSSAFSAGETVEYTYIPKGALEKTVHFVVDGSELPTETVTVTNRQQTKTLPAMTHGAHTLLVYFTATVDSETVRSNELYYELVVLSPSSTVPVIVSPFNQTTATQYDMLIIPYTVYTPNSISSQVALKVNGTTVQEITVGRLEQTWSYQCSSSGSLTLSIASGGVTKSLTLTVAASSIDVHAETDALSLYLTSYGRSNGEATPATWTDVDNSVSCTLSGFNFASNGWVSDTDGNTVLRVNNGARVTIPVRPFESDFRGTGKTLEFEFAARDVLDYDAVPISCMYNGRGFQLTAQRVSLMSEQSSISTQYKEDEHVRVSIVVEKRTENRLLLVYVNGIASGAVQYPDGDDFSQQVPAFITLGDDGITLDVYAVRIYENNLTRFQILDNWIADTRDAILLHDRYLHNDVYNEYGQIVIEKLPSDLPYFILNAAELPQYKGDKKTITGSYTDPVDTSNSFTFTNCQINVQGTSSAPYARKNYDMQFKSGFELSSGHADNYTLGDGIIPFNRFVLKADVASSEGANNVELVKLYCDANPYKRPEQVSDPHVRLGIWGKPIVVFWHDTTNDTTTFLGKYNFNLPKRAPEPYGYTGDMESWEFQNNTSDLMLFKTDTFDETMVTDPTTGDAKEAWRYDYEARFPSDEWTDYDKLQELQSFVVACDRSKATGDALAESVTYEGTEYTSDTAAYRLAKFRSEFGNYAEVQSFVFYYIFTELFLMVDSRAKNLFIGFSGSEATGLTAIDRKAVAEPYDMDTAIGTNNEGSLVFGYSLEDTDHIAGGADVFNGQQSVLWCNVRDAFPAEITAMYQTLRSTGAISFATASQRFTDHQAKWPEAVFNEDAWFKYLSPLIDPDAGKQPTDVYLPMMQGSKAEQRKWWLFNRFRYMDSKWNAGDALSQVIQLRGYAKADITVTPYADIYPTVKYGSYLVSQRGTHGVAATLECPLDNVNDTEIYVYSAPQLASVGDLSGLKVGFADFSQANKLQSIVVGSDATGYENPNLTNLLVGTNALLATVDARNCTALAGGIDLSGAANIEHVYMEGTAVTAVSLPVGGILKTLHLPDTITSLVVRNQPGITSFSVEGSDYSNVTTLRVENCGAAVPTLEILEDMSPNSRVRIVGFTMAASTTTDVENFFDYLDTMRGLDESGGNLPNAVAAGTVTGLGSITGAWLAEMAARYPDITIGYEHLTSTLTYKSYDGATTLYTESITDGGNGTYSGTPSRTSTAQYSYTFIGWSRDTDQYEASASATQGVTADRTVYAAYSRTVRTYTVYWKNTNGNTLETDQNVPYGTVPTYNGATPTNPESDGGPFVGWEPAPAGITGDTTYTANYREDVLTGLIERTIKRAANSEVTSIRPYAFANCTGLTTISLPNVTTIGSSAFNSCRGLTTVSFPNVMTIGDYAFYGCSRLTTANFPSATNIGSAAFDHCYSLTTASFPNATAIGSSAFYNCSSLTTADFPNVTTIGNGAFMYLSRLTTANFPNATNIGSSAFLCCSNLTTINFPSATNIGDVAFSGCSNLTTASFPNATDIGFGVFYSCYSLSTISFPSVTTIGNYAFYNCSSLTTASFPSATTIEGYAFQNCCNLTTVSFPNVTSIGSSAFHSCKSLTTISFPNVTSIGIYAFQSCHMLVSLYLTGVSSVPTLLGYAFAATPIGGYSASAGQYGSVFVPASLYNSFLTANNWSSISTRIVSVS